MEVLFFGFIFFMLTWVAFDASGKLDRFDKTVDGLNVDVIIGLIEQGCYKAGSDNGGGSVRIHDNENKFVMSWHCNTLHEYSTRNWLEVKLCAASRKKLKEFLIRYTAVGSNHQLKEFNDKLQETFMKSTEDQLERLNRETALLMEKRSNNAGR